ARIVHRRHSLFGHARILRAHPRSARKTPKLSHRLLSDERSPMITDIEKTMQLGDPVVHSGITIAPLFPRLQPRATYLTLEDAIPLGFRVTEIDASGSVPELLAHNPLKADVLLYDGEELLGAKQNRILNVTVLVRAQSDTRIPVSCVEEGRWSARSSFFTAAGHTAHAGLRRLKAEALSAEPMALGIAQ